MSVFLSLECKQVYNRLEFSVLRSKASQLEDGKERKKGEEDRGQGGSGISTAPWQGWACCGMVMAIGSSEAKVLACPEPLGIQGLALSGASGSCSPTPSKGQGPLRFENQPFTKREGSRSSGGLTSSRQCPNPVAGFVEVCQSTWP